MNTRIEHATLIAPRGAGVAVQRDVCIDMCDGVIHYVGLAAGAGPLPHGAERLDASRHLVLPGLVNTHHHLFQSLTRCRPEVQNAGLFDWLTRQYPVWRGLDYESLRLAATVSLAELVVGGCTTTSDHHYLFPRGSDVRIEAVFEAADALGVRVHVCRGSMTLGASRGGLPPDDCTEDDAAVLADYQRVLERFHDRRPHAMRRVDLAPCSPFNVTPELFRETVAVARQHGALLHTHAAETLDEERYCLATHGVRPIEFLQRHGWLGPDVYLAHCVHVNDAEIDLLARTRTAVAHCPVSNMRLGSGAAPLVRWLERGVRVGLGVDGSASNDGGNLLAAARQAMLLQRVLHGPAAIDAHRALRLATVEGADVLRRPELGRIEVGAAADLACFRMDELALAGAVEQDPAAALVLCHVGRADVVFVAGRRVVDGGRLVRVDEAALARQFNEAVRRAWCGG